jgi:peptide/nickel transport system permease protein
VGAIGPAGLLAGSICALLVLLAVLAPLIAPYDPAVGDVLTPQSGPSSAHWLGTDDTGRDILSRLLYGGRTSLGGPALVVLITATAGTLLAVSAAWFGGWFDALVSRLTDLLFSFPGLLLAIVVVAVFGTGFTAPVIALAIAYTPSVARVMRSVAVRERNLPYVAALRIQGASGLSICLRHIVPNLMPVLLVQITVGFGYAMIDLAAISFLGLGLQPPTSDWGLMIAEGQPAILNGAPQQALFAAATVLVAVVSFNVLGESIARRFEGTGR